MKISDLINVINQYDVKVIFDDIEKVKDTILGGGHIIYFTPVEGKGNPTTRVNKKGE